MRTEIVFFLNGERHNVGTEEAAMVLSDYLRLVRGLSGTKVVCKEGDCGACTVLCARPPLGDSDRLKFQPVNSCILSVAQLDGCILVTIEGLNTADQRTEIQENLVCNHAAQCGYCTPGIVMTLTGALENNESLQRNLSEKEARNALTGNLCRCTGYSPIISAACHSDLTLAQTPSLNERFATSKVIDTLRRDCAIPVWLKPSEASDFEFFAPLTAKSACAFLKKNPEARIIAAGTDLGVLRNKGKQHLSQVVSLHLLKDAGKIKVSFGKRKRAIAIGGNVSIHELRSVLKQKIPEFARYLDLFASPQIKNVATVIGNLANASPIGDLAPPLLVLNANLEISSANDMRPLALTSFFRGYRKTALNKGELISRVSFEIPADDHIFALYKVSQRKDLDISTINAAFNFQLAGNLEAPIISEARVAFGGVAAVPIRLFKLEQWLTGKKVDPELFELALPWLRQEISPISDLRATASYRGVVAENLFRRYLRKILSTKLEASHALL
jgi:xanthine dehydrogenase small subunit